MGAKYIGKVVFSDGKCVEKVGTIAELCEWADRLAAGADGDVKISIGQMSA